MADQMRLRGPDDYGSWVDDDLGLALGHRRLSILDLSPEGHQPMFSRSGRFVIVFNGEVYNFRELRSELSELGHSFRGGSDTEIILAAFEQWPALEALQRFVGMFAIALWDRQERKLLLARDRIGEKPLYFGWSAGTFLFASELKALRKHPRFFAGISRDALALLMRHNYIPSPWCIYAGLYKLLPGCMLELNYSDMTRTPADFSPWPEDLESRIRPVRYWNAREIIAESAHQTFEGSDQEAIDALDLLTRQAVRQQMVADVPLGAFLSGGVDSSTVVALMQAQSSQPVKTFSIGFHEGIYDEAPFAKEVARHLGTDHTELYATPKDALDVIPQLPALYDEPFSDSSQIPTFLVSKLARQHVTVSLSGDGGDELFCGYPRYLWANQIWRTISWMPHMARTALARSLHVLSEQQWDGLFEFARFLPGNSAANGFFRNAGRKVYRLSEVLNFKQPEQLYFRLLSHWNETNLLVPGSSEPKTVMTDSRQWPEGLSFLSQMMFIDLLSYLPDDIMVKVDRASMGVSLESRAPFLDYRVVEFAWRLPQSQKLRFGQSKWALRQLLYRYVPQSLIERPKMGFGVPIDSWLRGPLKEWAEDLLSEEGLRREGFFNVPMVRRKWNEHLSAKRNNAYDLWDILMFQAWVKSL